MPKSRVWFVKKYLDPADRWEEIVCGLIMVLDFTLIAGFTAGEGRAGVRHLLISALGCNVAWGIIDGVLNVMGNLTDRRQRLKFLTRLRRASDEDAVFSALDEKLGPLLEPTTSAEERAQICHILAPIMSRIELPEAGITRADIWGLAAIFWLDLISVIPAIIPFLIFEQPRLALRASNALLIASLFISGFMWAKQNRGRPFLAGLVLMLIGLGLVGVAIALGG